MRRSDRTFIDAMSEFRSLMAEAGNAPVTTTATAMTASTTLSAAASSSSGPSSPQHSIGAAIAAHHQPEKRDPPRFQPSSLFAAFPGLSEKTQRVLAETTTTATTAVSTSLARPPSTSPSMNSISSARQQQQQPAQTITQSAASPASSAFHYSQSSSAAESPLVRSRPGTGGGQHNLDHHPQISVPRSASSNYISSARRARVPGLLGLSMGPFPAFAAAAAAVTPAATVVPSVSASVRHEAPQAPALANSITKASSRDEQMQQQQQHQQQLPAVLSSRPASSTTTTTATTITTARSGSRPGSGSVAVERLRSLIDTAEADREAKRKLRIQRDIEALKEIQEEFEKQQQEQQEPQQEPQQEQEEEQQQEEVDHEEAAQEVNQEEAVEEEREEQPQPQQPPQVEQQPRDELTELEQRDWDNERASRRAQHHAEQEQHLADFLFQRRILEASTGLVWDERVCRADVEGQEKAGRAELSATLFDSLLIVRQVAQLESEESFHRDCVVVEWAAALFLPIMAPFLRRREKLERYRLMFNIQAWYNDRYWDMVNGCDAIELEEQETECRGVVELLWRESLPPILAEFTHAATRTLSREMWLCEVNEANGRGKVENDATEFFFVATEGQRWSKPLVERRAAATVKARQEWKQHIAALKADLLDVEAGSRMLIQRDGIVGLRALLELEEQQREEELRAEEERTVSAAIMEAQRFSETLHQDQRQMQRRDDEQQPQKEDRRPDLVVGGKRKPTVTTNNNSSNGNARSSRPSSSSASRPLSASVSRNAVASSQQQASRTPAPGSRTAVGRR